MKSVSLALVAMGLFASDVLESNQCLPFSSLSIVLEQNATDADNEVVVFAKGQDDGLDKLTIRAPNGRVVARFKGDRRGIGIREFQLESAEPPGLDLVLDSFPEGDYSFEGRTAEGRCLRGTASLSHDLAPKSKILSPGEDEVVARNNVVVTWALVPDAVLYVIEVKNERMENSLLVEVPAPNTTFHVPSTWLEPNTEHQVAVGVKTANGNVTNVEGAFFTAPE